MPYLWNEKRFCKNSTGFEFHVHRYRTGEIFAKIGEHFFCRPERVKKKAVYKGATATVAYTTVKRECMQAANFLLHKSTQPNGWQNSKDSKLNVDS